MLTPLSRSNPAISPRKVRRAGGLLLLLLGLSLGCKKVDDLRGGGEATPASSSAAAASSGAPTAEAAGDASGTSPLPFAVGQWTRYKTTRDGAPAGDVSYRVTGKEGNAFWIQIQIDQPGGKPADVSILIDFKNGRASKDFKVEKAKVTLPTGQTHTLSGPMLGAAMKGFGGQLAALAVDSLEGLPQEDVKVAAGDFKGCYYRDFDFKVMNIHSKGRVWNHTKVPINAMVKNESNTDGAKVVFELAEYGLTADDKQAAP